MDTPLLDSEDVGRLLGISGETIRRYLYESKEPGRRYFSNPFPEPDDRVGGSHVWFARRKDEILAWDQRRKSSSWV